MSENTDLVLTSISNGLPRLASPLFADNSIQSQAESNREILSSQLIKASCERGLVFKAQNVDECFSFERKEVFGSQLEQNLLDLDFESENLVRFWGLDEWTQAHSVHFLFLSFGA